MDHCGGSILMIECLLDWYGVDAANVDRSYSGFACCSVACNCNGATLADVKDVDYRVWTL